MKRRLTAAVTVAGLLGVTAVADAHHPEVVAVAGCVQNARASVFVTATAWQTGDPAHRVNDEIVIERWTGATWEIVGGGRFELGAPSFIIDTWLPANSGPPVTARFRARAVVAWGPNQEFGSANESREATVTVTEVCRGAQSTTTVSVSTTAPTTTTAAVSPTVVTSSTVLMREPALPEAPAAAAVVATPRFTG